VLSRRRAGGHRYAQRSAVSRVFEWSLT
jgi:hypothetical protein